MDETMRELVMEAASAEVFGVWFLIGAALVFWMQAGFAMVEAGFTRAKNTGNIIMKNLMDFCIGTVVFIFIGFGLLMGEDLFGFIGNPCSFVQRKKDIRLASVHNTGVRTIVLYQFSQGQCHIQVNVFFFRFLAHRTGVFIRVTGIDIYFLHYASPSFVYFTMA